MQMVRNNGGFEFWGGRILSYILLKATQHPTHFSFTIVNKMQTLENKDAFEFCGGWVIPHILLKATHLPFIIVNK